MRFGIGMNTDHTLGRSWATIFSDKRDELDKLKLKPLRKVETSKPIKTTKKFPRKIIFCDIKGYSFGPVAQLVRAVHS